MTQPLTTTRPKRRAQLHLAGFAALTALCSLPGCNGVPLAENLADSEANRVLVELGDNAVGAEKRPDPGHEGRYTVQVNDEELPHALAVLRSAGLPAEAPPGVLEALGESGLVASRKTEQARLVIGTAGELERSLSALDGVVGARVHLSIPDDDPLALSDQKKPASASVLIRHKGSSPPLLATDVQRLVAGAIGGLDPERVVVVFTSSIGASVHSEPMVRMGPLSVSPGSVRPLRIAVACVVALFLLLLGALLFVWLKARAPVRTASAARAEGQS
ncbi:MAG TPA: hypothetical protein VHM70_03760 [Polyangiaceae bacterium]|jgi:type III secretion protein J|nr:hypothetical protein [Polyangiaceae bacterium]